MEFLLEESVLLNVFAGLSLYPSRWKPSCLNRSDIQPNAVVGDL